MSRSAEWQVWDPGAAFDSIATSYDDTFTRSVIGRAQREAVWEVMRQTFRAGDRVLELNCGTGEDAFFLGRRRIAVEACDASREMIEVARRRKILEGPGLPIQFRQLPTEEICKLRDRGPFDGAVSNFAGLNCVSDLDRVGSDLSALVRNGGKLLLCFCNRVCLWELAWFSIRGNLGKARRRLQGSAFGRLGERSVHVWYPTFEEIERAFSPCFELRSARAVGLLVPPSYLEFWACRHGRLVGWLARIDRFMGGWAVLRTLGDHLVLQFEKVRA